MRTVVVLAFASFFVAGPALAQSGTPRPDSIAVTPPPAPGPHGHPEQPPRIYYGGSIGLSFGTYTRVSIQPMLGVRLTPKVSAGARVSYEYIKNTSGSKTYSSHSYGGGVFSRYRFIPQAYAHAEFEMMSYELLDGDRDWVPFLLLGGGYLQRLSKKTSAYVEVLVDVLQDENSPYGWDPVVNAGVGVGF